MPHSLVKYAREKAGSGDQQLFWDRIDADGYPFRGRYAPMMTETEYEARAVRVADYRNGFFDVTDPVQNKQFQEVMECCANGWFFGVYIERFWNHTSKHYMEWVEYYMEDGSRTPYLSPGVTEVASSGQHLSQALPKAG